MLRIDLNKAVLISYPLKTHVSRATPFRQGVARERHMASEPRKLFLSDPGDRLRARDEQIDLLGLGLQWRQRQIRTTHTFTNRTANSIHRQVTSPITQVSIPHPTPGWWEPSQAHETRWPTYRRLTGSTRGSEWSDGCRAHSWTHNPPRFPQINVRGPSFTSLIRRFPTTSYQELSLRTQR